MAATNTIASLLREMIAFDAGDPRRLRHLLQVRALAALVGREEGLDTETRLTLESAAALHDIGIHCREERYGSFPGHLREQEGPPLARELLSKPGFTAAAIRSAALSSRHRAIAPSKARVIKSWWRRIFPSTFTGITLQAGFAETRVGIFSVRKRAGSCAG